MRSFPNTDFYFISYFPGSSGTFLQSLMAVMFYDISYYSFTKNGNAINTINHRFFNERFDDQSIEPEPIYKNILNCIPIDSKRPVFSRSHNIPDINLLYEKFPRCKHIVIQLDDVGKKISYSQDFIKNFKELYRLGDINGSFKKWNHFSEKYFNNAKTPHDVSQHDILKYAEQIAKHEVQYPFDVSFDLSDTNMHRILLTDIHFDPNKVLLFLSEMLQKPITDNAKNYYQDYILKQRNIYDLLQLGNSYIGIDCNIHY